MGEYILWKYVNAKYVMENLCMKLKCLSYESWLLNIGITKLNL